MDDDGTGWNEVLLTTWSDEVRSTVVERVEHLTTGWRGPLVRTLRDTDAVPSAWIEALHATVVAAIAEVTGADLDELGSHAAWNCYEEVWQALTRRWADGGTLAVVPLGREPAVTTLLTTLPPEAAAAAGADTSAASPDPLWSAGRLRIDVEGLQLLLSRGVLNGADEIRIELLLRNVAGHRV